MSPHKQPQYRHQKARNCAVVRIDGRDFYLGPWQSPESFREYERLLTEWRAGRQVGHQKDPCHIRDLTLSYFKQARTYYCKQGEPTKTLFLVQAALKPLNQLFADLPAEQFGPRRLRCVQDHLVQQGFSRKYINQLVGTIRRAFRWATAEEMVPPSVWHGLQSVPDLQRGRTGAKEHAPILPVDPDRVEKTLPHLPPIVAAMVRLQQLTGMRPGEVCAMRPQDVTLFDDGTACYRPETHKMEHHGRERRVFLGPRSVALLRPYLERDGGAFCFSPAEVMDWRRALRSAARRTPRYRSHMLRNRRKRKAAPKRAPRDRYDTQSYGRAITAATRQAWPTPPGLTAEAAREFRRVHDWNPNQLRHLWATKARELEGIEAASVGLGHASLNTTEVYAERDFAAARRFAREHG